MMTEMYKSVLPDRWEPLLETPMLLGESPLWEPAESALYWIDITGKAVHRFSTLNQQHDVWSLPSEPGCIARCQGGGLIVAMRSGLILLNTSNGAQIPVANAPYDPSKIRFNDGRCDALGRLWTGTLYDSRSETGGSLFCVERGKIRDLHKPVTVSNGVAFSIDGRILYHTDTTAHRIMAYDFELASGSVRDGKIFQQFSTTKTDDYGGRPDGAAVDSENAYWCAMYEGGKILRFAPTGELLLEAQLPARCPTMIAFGGADMRTLYVTTARHNRPADELQQLPLSGCVFKLRVEVPGCIEPPYVP